MSPGRVGATRGKALFLLLGLTLSGVFLWLAVRNADLDAVGRGRASVALLVPTMINAILESPRLADADLSSLRRVFYGGGPMPPTVLRRALEHLRCGFTQGYGLTETLEATFLVAADHVDAFRAVHPKASRAESATFNSRFGVDPGAIDHIFVERKGANRLKPLACETIFRAPGPDSVWASDHFGVVAKLGAGK